MSDLDANTMVTVEQDGRILSGVGVSEESLAETMDRHAPDPVEPETPATPPVTAATPERPRNDQGQFAKPTRGQKRFDQLTGEKEAERRARETAEKERDDLRRQLEETRRGAPPPAQTERLETPPPATATERAAMPAHLKTYDAYLAQHPEADYEEFRDDRNLWLLESRQTDIDARIRHGIEADRATRTRADHIAQEAQRGRTAYSDFDATVQAPHMMTPNWPQWQIDAIMDHDRAEHIRYALGKDPTLAERFRTANPVQFGMELAQLVTSAAVASPASTARTVAHPPPAPYQPVAGGGTTTVPSSADLANKGDYDYDKSGYRERRARELGRR